ncbi:hypothetical protein, partial [Helicobacter rodentium]
LRIDAEVERFTQELKKYALKNGDSTQNFQVADAKNPNDAINKKQLDAMQKKAQELDAALEQKMQTTIKQTIETSTIAGATLTTQRGKETAVTSPVKTINFYKRTGGTYWGNSYYIGLGYGTHLIAQITVNDVVIYSQSVSVSCNNNNGG